MSQSLPQCPNYPRNQETLGIRNASDRASKLLQQRKELLQSLMLNQEGEMILRGKVQGTANALNVKVGLNDEIECQTIVYEAMQPMERACKAIRDNIEQQSTVEAELKV